MGTQTSQKLFYLQHMSPPINKNSKQHLKQADQSSTLDIRIPCAQTLRCRSGRRKFDALAERSITFSTDFSDDSNVI